MTEAAHERVPEHQIAAELRLRARRPTVVRLSRKVLIGLGAASSIAVLGAVAYAMSAQRAPKAKAELYNIGATPPEQVRVLPMDYRTPPRLGPPLPGDLGAPILEAGAPTPPIGRSDVAEAPETLVEAERRQRREESEGARTSTVFAGVRGEAPPSTAPPVNAMLPGASAPLANAGDGRTTNVDRLVAPVSPNVLLAGSVIPAALITGVNSDLPGQVVAQVTQSVFDTPTGRRLLIPQGARLIGFYENRIAFGQRRVLLAWTRLILPDGRSMALERFPAGDLEGYAGLSDKVERHWSGLFGMATLSTLLGVGAQLGSDDDENEIVQALRTGAGGAFNQVGQQAVGRGLDVAPTLTVRPGAPVRVIVTRDLVLEPILE